MRGLWKTRLRAQLLDEIYRLSAIGFREVLMKRAGLLGARRRFSALLGQVTEAAKPFVPWI
jgi:hypothetical protein